MSAARLTTMLKRVDGPPHEFGRLFREVVWDIAAADPWLYETATSMAGASAYESACLRLLPTGWAFAGLRFDPPTGRWFAAVLTPDGRIESSVARPSPAAAMLDVVLRAHIAARSKATIEEEADAAVA